MPSLVIASKSGRRLITPDGGDVFLPAPGQASNDAGYCSFFINVKDDTQNAADPFVFGLLGGILIKQMAAWCLSSRRSLVSVENWSCIYEYLQKRAFQSPRTNPPRQCRQ